MNLMVRTSLCLGLRFNCGIEWDGEYYLNQHDLTTFMTNMWADLDRGLVVYAVVWPESMIGLAGNHWVFQSTTLSSKRVKQGLYYPKTVNQVNTAQIYTFRYWDSR